jgi:type IV pilus assembly protein PilA
MNQKKGLTLIELMVVIAIIAILAALAIPTFNKFIAKSKRTEAYMQLHSLYAAEKIYWAEHGTYSMQLSGPGGIGWKPEGYHGGGADENFYYTYGFGGGSEGQSSFTGKLDTPASLLSGTKADKDEFVACAVGYINGEGKPDIISIDQNNTIVLVADALAD